MGDAPAPAPDVGACFDRNYGTVSPELRHCTRAGGSCPSCAYPAPASPALSMSNRSQSAAAAATADRLANSLGVDRGGRRRPSYVLGDGDGSLVSSNKPKKQKVDRKTGENTLAKVIFYGACNRSKVRGANGVTAMIKDDKVGLRLDRVNGGDTAIYKKFLLGLKVRDDDTWQSFLRREVVARAMPGINPSDDTTLDLFASAVSYFSVQQRY